MTVTACTVTDAAGRNGERAAGRPEPGDGIERLGRARSFDEIRIQRRELGKVR